MQTLVNWVNWMAVGSQKFNTESETDRKMDLQLKDDPMVMDSFEPSTSSVEAESEICSRPLSPKPPSLQKNAELGLGTVPSDASNVVTSEVSACFKTEKEEKLDQSADFLNHCCKEAKSVATPPDNETEFSKEELELPTVAMETLTPGCQGQGHCQGQDAMEPAAAIQSDTAAGVTSTGRNLRKVRKRTTNAFESHSVVCPVCRASLRPSDVHSHVQVEIDRLRRTSRSGKKRYSSSASDRKVSASCSNSQPLTGQSSESGPPEQSGYQTFLQIQKNRQLRATARKRKREGDDEEGRCPVCNQRIVGTQEELTQHVDLCLKQEEAEVDIEGEGDNDDDVDDGGDEEYEEYTWAGQTRIRATTMLHEGLSASGFQSCSKSGETEDDGDLNVDDDDTAVYGSPQYTEADIIPCSSEEPKEEKGRKAIRNAMLEGKANTTAVPTDRLRWSVSNDVPEERCSSAPETGNNTSENNCSEARPSNAVTSMKNNKVKKQSEQSDKVDCLKCLICMEAYSKPTTSIQCWHVHCEECWLRTLGAKKLCPQCNTITSAMDLRRIYL